MSPSVTRPRAALVALAMLFGLLIPVTLSQPASAAPVPSTELLVNGSFETGDFTGWETEDMAVPFSALAVSPVDSHRPCLSPTDGMYAVGHGFDGGGPDTIEFWQEVTIPAGYRQSCLRLGGPTKLGIAPERLTSSSSRVVAVALAVDEHLHDGPRSASSTECDTAPVQAPSP